MSKRNPEAHLSFKGALAFSIGTSVGWGSLVVTCNTYLAKAGPLGSILGLLCGAAVMLVISRNYAILIRTYPDAGGAYSYSRDIFGYDYGFLTAWFLAMTYLAILWANVTSLPLYARIFMGDLFKKGRIYSLFNYDVYLGEVILCSCALIIVGCLCMKYKRAMDICMIILTAAFTVGIALCFLASVFGKHVTSEPLFLQDTSALSQIMGIAVISPWAFIGFESISHASEEFTFNRKKTGSLLVISVILTTAIYIMITALSVTAYPSRYTSWLEYINDLGNLSGLEKLPPFYAAYTHMGNTGVYILMLALLALVITSLIGNITALSRLFYAMARDHILPVKISKLNSRNIPSNAILAVIICSVLIPFTGRTAIGWIVDVTTIGATPIYGVVSAATFKISSKSETRAGRWTGLAGMIMMIFFGAYLLLPNFVSKTTIARETFLLFSVWSVLGFIYFRVTLHRDRERRFGSSVIVWVVLLSLVLFISFFWMRQSMLLQDSQMKTNVRNYFVAEGIDDADKDEIAYIESQLDQQGNETTRIMMVALGIFGFALLIMLTNHNFMNSRSMESELKANTDIMTGHKNKHAFTTREAETDSLIRDGVVRDFAIVVCDVNGLKVINDTLGHKAGDEYIIKAGQLICEIFKHSPVYRIGGDEFAAILSGRDYNMRDELMRLLHERSAGHITSGGVVVAGGISEFVHGEDEDFHTVFVRADKQMYEEKKRLKDMNTTTLNGHETPSGEGSIEIMNALMEEKAILNVKRSILIVDNEMTNRVTLGNAMRSDYEILYATDGIEGLEQINKHKDDLALIMMDLDLPRMNGVELIGRLKEDAALKDIPFIVLAADQESEVECLQLGAVDFIPKPYPAPEIIKARADKCIELLESRNIIQSTERDRLTNLFNMDYFVRYVHLFDHYFPETDMDAVVVDINRFHMINERYGKEYGDEILKTIGENIREQVRVLKGVGCHQGADTFLLYIPHLDNYNGILQTLTDDLTHAGTSKHKGEGTDSNTYTDSGSDTDINIRLRLGVYYNADKTIDIERRFDRAKMAADNIRGSYTKFIGVYDSAMHEDILFKERLLEEFRQSLIDGQFTTYFQPKYDIRPKSPLLTSAEALVRWNHPVFGIISPGLFIPLLEEHGLIFDLDLHVWDETAAYIRHCKDNFGFSVPISVNVSRIDMLRPDLKEVFDSLLLKHDLTPSDMLLEITESAYTGDSDQVITMVNRFRDAGFGIEMDDFGTGYSSLGMLSKLPIDALKMDMSFVHTAFGESRDMRMIELIIDIAEHLKVPVIAEGVETEDQYLTLREMGCDIIQGYYFSKPVSGDKFNSFIIERISRKDA
ncbi:MAG: amino acid permease [Lachnospiraceae bacterium]|nr:amino acid permease [Lachnospiraceae bacterium]